MRVLQSVALLATVTFLVVGVLGDSPIIVNTPFGEIQGVASDAAYVFKVRILAFSAM